MKEIVSSLILMVGIILFFWAPGYLIRTIKVRHEVMRKTTHVLASTASAVSIFFFDSPRPLLILVVFFTALFAVGPRLRLFPGVYRKERASYGPAYFAATCGILLLLTWTQKYIMFTALLTMALADSTAAVVGTGFPYKEYEIEGYRRTLSGSLSMLPITLLVVGISLIHFTALDPLSILSIACACAVFVALTEAISPSDADNMTIPLMCALLIYLMAPLTLAGHAAFWGKSAVALAVAAFSLRAGFLKLGGAIGVFLIGALIFVIGGLAWVIPMVTFFFSASLISLWGKEQKSVLRTFHARSGPRDMKQIMAKGGIPCLIAIWFSYTKAPHLYLAYLCSLAAANADTWASEIGFFSRRPPVSIINLKPVPRGTSGGITVTGYLAAGLGSAAIGLAGFPFYSADLLTGTGFVLLIILAGIFACTVDSVIGAAAQAKLLCPHCGEITENPNHCSEFSGVLSSGKSWVNNEVVNLACSFAGAAFAVSILFP